MKYYSKVNSHHSMIFDDLRNGFYKKAIQKTINTNHTVLDLGAGLGLHGFMALESGAKKVYFVDPSDILDITEQVIKSNHLSQKSECLKEKIEEIKLPGKVDVIISVFTGNFLLSEDLLPSLFYARDTFLHPEGKLIPDRAKMIVAPVSAEDYYKKNIDCWSEPVFGVDYRTVRKYAVNTLYFDEPAKRKVNFLSKPINIFDIDFTKATDASCKSKNDIKVQKNGTLHGFLGWFEARIGEEWMTTSPLEKQMHWTQVFLPLENPLDVKAGESVFFELIRPEYGNWTWIVKYKNIIQKHSTFLSNPISKSSFTIL